MQATLKQISLTEYPLRNVPYKNVIQMRQNGQNGYKVINSQLQLQDFSKVRENKDCNNINSVKQYAQKTQQILIQVQVYFGVIMTVKQPTQSKCKQQQQQLFQEYGLLRKIYYRMSHLRKQDIFIQIKKNLLQNVTSSKAGYFYFNYEYNNLQYNITQQNDQLVQIINLLKIFSIYSQQFKSFNIFLNINIYGNKKEFCNLYLFNCLSSWSD
eukprot:TRINITY_DN11388_c0_g1_i3.p2 TRINITY_DN11388_c0_g1~~TRINITY_DN11388_c0_g1_i3.p2  ORF type:complete len:212 (+),score=-12.53 TRINITY_DN11388_c0_g1_i3:725-1360(+)